MDIAIAVGLITAGSTIAGGVIVSITTLKAQKNQMRHQEMLAGAERQEKRRTDLRTMRRELYETLLSGFDEIVDLMTECWRDKPCVSDRAPANDSEIALEKGVKSLDKVINSVMLEGSPSIIKAAYKAKQILWAEMIAISKLSLATPGVNQTLQSINPDEYVKYYQERVSAKYEIIKAAAAMLQDSDSDRSTLTTSAD